MQSMANMPAWKEGSGSGSEGEDEVADATSGSDSDSDEDKAFQVRGGLLLVLFYFILFYFILFYFILFYFILFYLSYRIAPTTLPSHSHTRHRLRDLCSLATPASKTRW